LLVLGCPLAADAQSASRVRVQNFSYVHLLPPPIAVSPSRNAVSSRPAASGPPSPARVDRRRPVAQGASKEHGIVAAGENTASENSPSEYEESEIQSIKSIVPLQVTKNPFETESRVPVARLWGTPVELNFSAVTLRNNNVVAGPLTSGETLHPAPFARSTELFGVGVTIPLGRSGSENTSKNLWHSLTQIARDR